LLFACAKPPAVPVRAEQSFAWTAKSPVAGAGRIFLMGSMHMGLGPMQLGPVLSDAFTRADALVMEVDPDEIGLLETLRLSSRYGQLPGSETLPQHLSPETYELLLAWCDRRGERAESYSPFRPWFAAAIVELKEYEARGHLTEYGSEEQFMRLAKQQKMQLEALESAEEQMQILSSMSPGAQEQMLRSAVEADDEEFDELLHVWQRGDEEGLARILLREWDEPSARELLEALVVDRNLNMVERLHERMLDGRDRFVLVGAAHMVGEHGIPSLLAQRGYDVERVRGNVP